MLEEIKNKLEATFPRNSATLSETLDDMISSNLITDFVVFDDAEAFDCYFTNDGENFTRVILGKV